MKEQSATKSHGQCACSGSDLALSRGPGRVLERHGITVALPEAFEYKHCRGCGKVALTRAQVEELNELIDRNEIGVGRRGEPVTRGT